MSSERHPRGRGPGTGTKRKTALGPPVRVMTHMDADKVSNTTWCDTREAAGLLGVLPDGVTRLAEAGRLRRHPRPGCFPFYSRREVAALADEIRKESE